MMAYPSWNHPGLWNGQDRPSLHCKVKSKTDERETVIGESKMQEVAYKKAHFSLAVHMCSPVYSLLHTRCWE